MCASADRRCREPVAEQVEAEHGNHQRRAEKKAIHHSLEMMLAALSATTIPIPASAAGP